MAIFAEPLSIAMSYGLNCKRNGITFLTGVYILLFMLFSLALWHSDLTVQWVSWFLLCWGRGLNSWGIK
jgi:hypothetical protein